MPMMKDDVNRTKLILTSSHFHFGISKLPKTGHPIRAVLWFRLKSLSLRKQKQTEPLTMSNKLSLSHSEASFLCKKQLKLSKPETVKYRSITTTSESRERFM